MEEVAILALAAWAVTWVLTFWGQLDGLRERLGVGFDRDANGCEIERWGSTRIGEWLNCPACCAVLGSALVALWWALRLPMMPIKGLAALGLVMVVVRWWQGARVKAEWWV
jgi:hypothetical protein